MKTAEQIILAYDQVDAPDRVDLCITHPDCEAAMEEYAKQFAMSKEAKNKLGRLLNSEINKCLMWQDTPPVTYYNELLKIKSELEKLQTI